MYFEYNVKHDYTGRSHIYKTITLFTRFPGYLILKAIFVNLRPTSSNFVRVLISVHAVYHIKLPFHFDFLSGLKAVSQSLPLWDVSRSTFWNQDAGREEMKKTRKEGGENKKRKKRLSSRILVSETWFCAAINVVSFVSFTKFAVEPTCVCWKEGGHHTWRLYKAVEPSSSVFRFVAWFALSMKCNSERHDLTQNTVKRFFCSCEIHYGVDGGAKISCLKC